MITLVRCKLLELYQSLSTFMHAELAPKKFIILVPRGRGLDEKPIVASTTKLHSSSSQISKIPKPVLTRPDLKRAQIAKPVFVPKKKEVEKVKSSGVKTQREKEKAASKETSSEKEIINETENETKQADENEKEKEKKEEKEERNEEKKEKETERNSDLEDEKRADEKVKKSERKPKKKEEMKERKEEKETIGLKSRKKKIEAKEQTGEETQEKTEKNGKRRKELEKEVKDKQEREAKIEADHTEARAGTRDANKAIQKEKKKLKKKEKVEKVVSATNDKVKPTTNDISTEHVTTTANVVDTQDKPSVSPENPHSNDPLDKATPASELATSNETSVLDAHNVVFQPQTANECPEMSPPNVALETSQPIVVVKKKKKIKNVKSTVEKTSKTISVSDQKSSSTGIELTLANENEIKVTLIGDVSGQLTTTKDDDAPMPKALKNVKATPPVVKKLKKRKMTLTEKVELDGGTEIEQQGTVDVATVVVSVVDPPHDATVPNAPRDATVVNPPPHISKDSEKVKCKEKKFKKKHLKTPDGPSKGEEAVVSSSKFARDVHDHAVVEKSKEVVAKELYPDQILKLTEPNPVADLDRDVTTAGKEKRKKVGGKKIDKTSEKNIGIEKSSLTDDSKEQKSENVSTERSRNESSFPSAKNKVVQGKEKETSKGQTKNGTKKDVEKTTISPEKKIDKKNIPGGEKVVQESKKVSDCLTEISTSKAVVQKTGKGRPLRANFVSDLRKKDPGLTKSNEPGLKTEQLKTRTGYRAKTINIVDQPSETVTSSSSTKASKGKNEIQAEMLEESEGETDSEEDDQEEGEDEDGQGSETEDEDTTDREDGQSANEDGQSANEDGQSANEDGQSADEDGQSANEDEDDMASDEDGKVADDEQSDDEQAGDDPNNKKSTADDDVAKEMLAEKFSTYYYPGNQMSADDLTANNDPVNDMSADEFSSINDPADQMSANELSASDDPANQMSASDDPANQMSADELSAKDDAANETSADELSANDVPVNQVSADNLSEESDVEKPTRDDLSADEKLSNNQVPSDLVEGYDQSGSCELSSEESTDDQSADEVWKNYPETSDKLFEAVEAGVPMEDQSAYDEAEHSEDNESLAEDMEVMEVESNGSFGVKNESQDDDKNENDEKEQHEIEIESDAIDSVQADKESVCSSSEEEAGDQALDGSISEGESESDYVVEEIGRDFDQRVENEAEKVETTNADAVVKVEEINLKTDLGGEIIQNFLSDKILKLIICNRYTLANQPCR